MIKFWKWMKNNKYSFLNQHSQTLMSYMLEYIINHSKWKEKTTPFFQGDLAGVEIRLKMISFHKDMYGELKDIILLFDKEE